MKSSVTDHCNNVYTGDFRSKVLKQTSFTFQSILHKTCPEAMKGRTRGDSVRFQNVISPVKEIDSGVSCSENSPLIHDGKDMTDRVSFVD
jgi:hypothetical protein